MSSYPEQSVPGTTSSMAHPTTADEHYIPPAGPPPSHIEASTIANPASMPSHSTYDEPPSGPPPGYQDISGSSSEYPKEKTGFHDQPDGAMSTGMQHLSLGEDSAQASQQPHPTIPPRAPAGSSMHPALPPRHAASDAPQAPHAQAQQLSAFPPPPPSRKAFDYDHEDSATSLQYIRDPHRLIAYLVPFPKPHLKGIEPSQIPDRFSCTHHRRRHSKLREKGRKKARHTSYNASGRRRSNRRSRVTQRSRAGRA
ncbi:hypothetical protein MRB53_039023 [Persea americana]|nr:hypothetical protein MRB53_039023 [Persea americana]